MDNGSLFGKWLSLSDYYEYVPEGLINESWISEHVFNLMEIIFGMHSDTADAFGIRCSNGHESFSVKDQDDLLENFQEEYIRMYGSEEDFARVLMEQRDDLNDFAKQYVDCAVIYSVLIIRVMKAMFL